MPNGCCGGNSCSVCCYSTKRSCCKTPCCQSSQCCCPSSCCCMPVQSCCMPVQSCCMPMTCCYTMSNNNSGCCGGCGN